MNRSKNYTIGAGCIILAGVAWAVDYTFLRGSLYEYDPMLIVTAEHIFGIVLFTILFVLWTLRDATFFAKSIEAYKLVSTRGWIALLLIAVLGGLLATYALITSLFLVMYDTLALPAVFQKLQPLFAIAGAVLLLGEKMKPHYWRVVLLVLCGSYLVTFGLSWPRVGENQHVVLASVWALVAAACWGIQTVLARYVSTMLSYYEIMRMRLLLTAIFGLLLVVGGGDLGQLLLVMMDHWKIFILIALLSGIIAGGLYYFGIRRVDASHATIFELSLPVSLEVFTVFTGVGVLFSTYQWVGVIIITTSVLFLLSRSS